LALPAHHGALRHAHPLLPGHAARLRAALDAPQSLRGHHGADPRPAAGHADERRQPAAPAAALAAAARPLLAAVPAQPAARAGGAVMPETALRLRGVSKYYKVY